MSAGKVVSGPGETGALVEDVVEGAVWVVSLTATHTSGGCGVPLIPGGSGPILAPKQRTSVCAPVLVGKPLGTVPLGVRVGFVCMLPVPGT